MLGYQPTISDAIYDITRKPPTSLTYIKLSLNPAASHTKQIGSFSVSMAHLTAEDELLEQISIQATTLPELCTELVS